MRMGEKINGKQPVKNLDCIPPEPGVYLMQDSNGEILYIGKSKKLSSRVRSYFRPNQPLSPRIAMMVRQVTAIEFIVTDTEAEALALEANLVKEHLPYYNILLKDDKKYPYVCITWSEDYPRIFITRKRLMGNAGDKYYGPYVDGSSLRNTLELIKRIFPLRQRPRPLFKNRPCLNYDLGRCPGVCQELISPEEYRQTMTKVAMIFQGRTGELLELLQCQMERAAAELNFEGAALIRDRLNALEILNSSQKVCLPDDTVSRDVIALAADGEHCSIQLFQIRAGRLVGRLGFFTGVATPGWEGKEKSSEEGAVPKLSSNYQLLILQQILTEHYGFAEPREIPSEILLQHKLAKGSEIEQWLSEMKGRKVKLLIPQRQEKVKLIEMVARNARHELESSQRLVERDRAARSDLAEILDLPELPRRIEGYDISHIQGSNAVGSQVVFIDGVPAKQHYRHYKIQNPAITSGRSDDFASLAEVMGRRFRPRDSSKEEKPDLIIIDGGKGQLSAVVAILEELNVLEDLQVISLAKQREEIFLPGESEPLDTDAEQPGVQLLRRVRDEAHRFAVSFHRQQRLKQQRKSLLDDIPGLGWQRQKQLLAHFHSVDYIRQASEQQLAEVSGIGPSLARTIYNYFHE